MPDLPFQRLVGQLTSMSHDFNRQDDELSDARRWCAWEDRDSVREKSEDERIALSREKAIMQVLLNNPAVRQLFS